MTPTIKPLAVVVDANILISLCAKEQKTYQPALNALSEYARRGALLFAPNILIAEVLYVLCQKAAQNLLTLAEHQQAIEEFICYLKAIKPPNSEAALVVRAEKIRTGYGCSRTSDALYLALAEELTASWTVEVVTFDNGFTNQAAKNAPIVKVNVLPV